MTSPEFQAHLLKGEQAAAQCVLNAPRIAARGPEGEKIGRQTGSSLEFIDRRGYQPGDDLRAVDWTGYARTDKLIVKLFRSEVSPHADILIDGSRSMNLPDTPKAEAALGIAAAVAASAANARYNPNPWLAAEDGVEPIQNGRARPSEWQNVRFDSNGNPPEAFLKRPPSWKPHGIRILISDLMWIGDPLLLLSRIAQQAAAAAVIQVLADADREMPERGNARFRDSETDQTQEIFLDENALQRYRNALTRHEQSWRAACKQTGTAFAAVSAETVAAEWKLDALVKAEILNVA